MHKPDGRTIKRDINYRISLNDEQKAAKKGIYDKSVSIILGKQGSGKSQTAVITALDMLFKKLVDKIIISRPVVRNSLGFLPGELSAKMENQIAPLKQCMYEAYDPVKIDKLFTDKVIQILPVDFMKGITYLNAVVIIDEFQDLNYEDFVLTLTRLGKGSKVIYTGSVEQVDRSIKDQSCISRVSKLQYSELVNFVTLQANHRHPLIFDIINQMES